jgi:acetyl-CoA carboxylase biotin carboxyl carrier protein
MDLKLIHRLIRMMERGEVSELEIEDEQAGLRIKLRRGPGVIATPPPVVGIVHGAPIAAPVPVAAAAPTDGSSGPAAPSRTGAIEIKSPMVGTFYRASSPENEPFVSAGTRVGADTVVCIIEAMKVMNEIKAETSGEIVEILVENGDPVEYGQPLFLVMPD